MYIDILKRIKAGQFIYILALPESLSNKQFYNIFTSPSFYLYVFFNSNVVYKRAVHTSEPGTSKTHQKLEKSHLNISTTT